MAENKQEIVSPSFVSFTNTWHNTGYDAISPFRPELSVRGKTVVVTGAGTGIGKAAAKAFVQAGAAAVTILGRREEKLKSAIDDIKHAISADSTALLSYEVVDLTQREKVNSALNDIVQRQGAKIDILVSNAGTLAPPGAASIIAEDDFMQGFEINVRTTLNAVHAFLPLATEHATLLNISSGVAHMSPMLGVSAHVVGKAAQTKLIDFIQAENPDLHVVNIQPGVVDTEALRDAGVTAQDDDTLPGQFCVWLASAEANFLKGKFVWANWDVKELIARAEEIKSSRLLTVMLEGVPM